MQVGIPATRGRVGDGAIIEPVTEHSATVQDGSTGRGPHGPTASPTSGAGVSGARAGASGDRTWLRAALAVATIGWGAQQFTPLLLLYQDHLKLSLTMVQATFVPYVVGLIPGLLFGGPFSDRFGRRTVMAPTMLASVTGTVLLILGDSGIGWVFAGRLVSGIASGAGFSCGGAWIKELSASSSGPGVSPGNPGPRRLTVAMGTGFGLGPLGAGVLAQWAPHPDLSAYVPHLLLCAAAFVSVLCTPETVGSQRGTSLLAHLRIREVRDRRFTTVVMPLAPWVFIVVAVAVGYLPGLVKQHISGHPIIFCAGVAMANGGAGILIQPFAKRIDRPGTTRLLVAALCQVVVGLLVAATAATFVQPALALLASLILGAGYGCCQIYGLLEVQRLASPDHLAGLTATYQALTYVGMTASFPLAALGTVVPPGILLIGVAVLAVATLVWTRHAVGRTTTRRAESSGELRPDIR